MDLIDRYVHAVRFWLPRAQQDDVAAELAEDIRSQIEDQESRLGRKLTDLEVASILKERGRPFLVANRFLPQRHLIGPLLFPVYRFVLTLAALCYVLPWMLAWIGIEIFNPFYRSHPGALVGGALGTFWLTAFVVFGVITLVFALIERLAPNCLQEWDPCKLPAVRPVRDSNRIRRLDSTIEIAVNLVFIMWWLSAMWSQTVFDREGMRIVFAPVWRDFFWAFLLLAVADIILAAANLTRPYWTWPRASIQLALTVAGSVAFCWICKANVLSQIVVPNLSPVRAAELVNSINIVASKCFPFAVFACVLIVALSGVGRLIRQRTSRKRLIRGLAA